MRLVLICAVIGYFGIIILQGVWYAHGELTEKRFALFQVTYLSFLILTFILYSSSLERAFRIPNEGSLVQGAE